MYETYFVVQEFTGSVYDELRKRIRDERILGPTALMQLMSKERPLPELESPLYTLAMEGVVVAFCGFQDKKNEMEKLSNMVLMMGGCVRTQLHSTVTHLIANCCYGKEYRFAQKANKLIMKEEWVMAWWNLRDLISWSPSFSEHLITIHKLQPFHGAKICFFGFNKEHEEWYCTVLEKYGGKRARISDKDCTHVVIAYDANLLPPLKSRSAFVVEQDWFWESVECDARLDENEYLFDELTVVENKANLSVTVIQPRALDKKKLEKRRSIFFELIKTEINYVRFLDIIMTQFKLPLEDLVRKGEKEVLSTAEINILFGNFSSIHEVHKELLDELLSIDLDSADYFYIGKIFMKFEPKFLKVYPPYINYYDITKAVLEVCEKDQKFAAFVKKYQPECVGHSLKELLIAPVQRLAKISSLLTQIFDCTDKSSPDYYTLEMGVFSIRQVLIDINEGKRSIDLHVTTLKMFNEIDNCPPDLLWSNRKFFSKNDVVEVTKGNNGRNQLTMFLFTDCIVICKKTSNKRTKKPYKFVTILNLKKIRRVIAVLKENEGNKMFAFLMHKPAALEEHILAFKFINDTSDNLHYLYTISKQIAYVTRTLDPVTKFDVLRFYHIEHKIKDGLEIKQ